MEKRRGKSSDHIALKLVLAVCLLSCIVGVAYTKADRTAILLSTDSGPQTQVSTVGFAPPASLEASEPNPDPRVAVEIAARHEQVAEWQTIRMRVTAYCPCPKCCGQYSDGITANGHRIRPGDTFVAADRRYSFGTEMIIPGYSNGQPVKVLDRGGAIRGDKLDAFFHTHQEALQWGVKYLDVKVRSN